jgi:glucoamylase
MKSVIALVAAQKCSEPSFRVDCGAVGTGADECTQAGCCWAPVNPNPSNQPWCFKPGSEVQTCSLKAEPKEPFTAAEVSQIEQNLLANVNWKGSGMVVAAPDPNTPGGNYEYAWMRDEALTMAAVIKFGLDDSKIAPWVQWLEKSVTEQDPNQIPVLTEPKFEIPSGEPYTGGWCRPQNDGPGLRALALICLWAPELGCDGMPSLASNKVSSVPANWDLVWTHLDWVAANHDVNGCDLWEEVQSTDFFWNRYTMRAALLRGAKAAQKQGDSGRASTYAQAAQTVEASLSAHFSDGWVFESTNRKLDTAVVEAFNVGDMGDGKFAPLSAEVVGTQLELSNSFCGIYDLNQQNAKAGTPGILYGRYPGDIYAGGNPWILLSATVATLFYRQAAAAQAGAEVPAALEPLLGKITDGPKQLLAAGDAIMNMLKKSLNDGMHMAEQIDRNSGKQISAKDLTWSYVNALKAVKARQAVKLQEQVVV